MYLLISLGLLIVGCFKSSSVMLITSGIFAIADALDRTNRQEVKKD